MLYLITYHEWVALMLNGRKFEKICTAIKQMQIGREIYENLSGLSELKWKMEETRRGRG